MSNFLKLYTDFLKYIVLFYLDICFNVCISVGNSRSSVSGRPYIAEVHASYEAARNKLLFPANINGANLLLGPTLFCFNGITPNCAYIS